MIGLYAIAYGAPRGGVGAQGERLKIVSLSDLDLVCGDASPALSADALRAHEAAVRRIADVAPACLPARFGASASDEAALLKAVSRRQTELEEALRLVRGREQMTLRLHGETSFTPRPTGGGPGTRYLEERRRVRALPELDPLRAALADLVRSERVERHAEPGLLASVYHLIDRGASGRYRELLAATPLEGLRVTASGPWPAWSFVPELLP
jgi:hypothetical protein